MNRAVVVVAVTPVVLMIAGVPFFSADRRIWVLPELGFWFLVWILVTPCFLAVADWVRVKSDHAATAEDDR